MTTEERPYRIQTPSGYRKYLCSGLYMPSVTTVLSATETEKSKASLRTWQKNNPGALEERTGYKCDVALIIVSTPETTQGIFIDSDQMDRHEAKFLQRCKLFHSKESSENSSSD